MPIVTFAPVERRGTRIIVTAYSESRGGKTHSLLRLGRGLVGPQGKLAMLDTESGRGRMFADLIPGGYDYAELTAPFDPERYIEAIDAAESAGYQALVIDSGSHEWEGMGGILESADKTDAKGLLKWAKPKARHKKYVQRLLRSQMHILISLRAKEKFVQLARGDTIPEGMKVGDIISSGMIPIQDKRFIFETTIQLFFPDGNRPGVPSLVWPQFKCPAELVGAFPEGRQISEDCGRVIADWLASAKPIDREMERLKTKLEEVAEEGSAALRTYWQDTLTKDQRRALAYLLENLRSIAAASDREREPPPDHRSFQRAGDAPAPTLAERMIAALAECADAADVDRLFDENALAFNDMPDEEWAALRPRFDARRQELAE